MSLKMNLLFTVVLVLLGLSAIGNGIAVSDSHAKGSPIQISTIIGLIGPSAFG